MANKKGDLPEQPPGRMPERSAAISGDEAKGLTVTSAAQSETVKAEKLAKIAKPPVRISKDHKKAWARLDAGAPRK